MFLFGKKKNKSETQKESTPALDKPALIAQAEEKITELEQLTGMDRVPVLNDIGSLFLQADEWDRAIPYYEESLELDKRMGKAYTDLMSLYNKKRQQAAEAKNDEDLKFYMDKVQGMMQMSKDMMRGKS